MQKNNSNKIETELVNKIISVAYGEAGLIDRIVVLWEAVRNENVKQLLEDFRTTANGVHKLKQIELPEYITEKVSKKIAIKTESESFFSKIPLAFFLLFSRKLIPVAAAGIIILAVVSFFIFREPEPTHKYTKAEIELAEKQFKQSLAIVGKVFKRTEEKLDRDILKTKVSKQVNKGLIIVHDYITGG